jgi:hypothetical protein
MRLGNWEQTLATGNWQLATGNGNGENKPNAA